MPAKPSRFPTKPGYIPTRGFSSMSRQISAAMDANPKYAGTEKRIRAKMSHNSGKQG